MLHLLLLLTTLTWGRPSITWPSFIEPRPNTRSPRGYSCRPAHRKSAPGCRRAGTTVTYAARRTAMKRARLRWPHLLRAGVATAKRERRVRSRDDVPIAPRIERAGHAARDKVEAVHQPDRRRAIAVLPQNVGPVVAVEVAAAFDLPARPRIEWADGTDGHRVGAVHQPDRRRAVVVLPQDVGLAVAVEKRGASPRAAEVIKYSGGI